MTTVRVVVDAVPPPWQQTIVAELRAVADVRLEPSARAPGTRSHAVALYARLDRWEPPAGESAAGAEEGPADAVVDLTGAGGHVSDVPVLVPEPARLDEEELLGRLGRGERTLRLAVRRVHPDGSAVVAAESTIALVRLSARRSSARAAPRLAALMVRAVEGLGGHDLPAAAAASAEAPARPTTGGIVRLLGRAAVAAVKVAVSQVDWRVAHGTTSSPDPFAAPSSLRALSAPAGHFYADPFVVSTPQGAHVFVEDFDHAAGYASIAVVDLTSGAATTILDTGKHLSYPFVFADDGTWYVVPESAAAREVVLHRCERFPDRWTRDTVLLEGVEAYDGTLLRHEGRWWLFFAAGTRGAPDDELHVWFADALRGPYAPHPLNPVVSTVVGARPAGRIAVHDGRLLRPGQDGSREYGGAIVVNEIDELTPTAYREHLVARIDGAVVGAPGTHTWNRAGDVVVVDTKHRAVRLPRRR